VRFHQYRQLKGTVLDVTLRKEAGDKWFVCFAVDLGPAPKKVPVRSMVGIDVGLTTFATVSDGTEIPNPRFGRNAAAMLARRQQALSQKRRGSASRRRAKGLIAKAHALIQNQRKDHARKLAVFFCQKYDLIAHEDLNIRGMVHGNLARSIHDAAWGTFIHALTCKAEEAGKWVIPVDPRGTTQRCSACGTVVQKDLSVRVHDCPACGLRLGRDLNAARNVLALGRSAVAVAEGSA
jgi:putative transposase